MQRFDDDVSNMGPGITTTTIPLLVLESFQHVDLPMIEQALGNLGSDPQWIGLIVGSIFLIGGWLLYWLSIHLYGAVIIGGAGFMLADFIGSKMGLEDTQLLIAQISGGAIGALLGVVISNLMHYVAFFVFGCIVGASVFYTIVSAGRADYAAEWARSDAFFAFGIPIAGVLMGALSVFFSRFVITITTATIGATLIMASLNWPLGGLGIPLLALAGGIVQYAIAKPFRKEDEEDEED